MDSGSSIYRPPSAGLERAGPTGGDWGSIDRAVAGEVPFEIGPILSEAWERTGGSKGVVMAGVLLVYAISLGLGVASTLLQATDPESGAASAAAFLLNLASVFVTYPLTAGILIYGVRRAASDPEAGFGDLLSCLPLALPLVGLYLLQGLLTVVGLLLLVLPGIYLAIAYSYGVLLLAERRLGVWQALETSRKALTHCWFQYFAFLLALGGVNVVVGVLTLGIGLVWSVPWALLAYAIGYRNLFGVAESRPGSV